MSTIFPLKMSIFRVLLTMVICNRDTYASYTFRIRPLISLLDQTRIHMIE